MTATSTTRIGPGTRRVVLISGNQRVDQRESAFTLLEIMLALVLFAVGTVAVMELFHRAQAGSTDGEHVLVATYQAQQCLESLRNVTFPNLTIGSGVLSSVSGCGASISGLPSGSRSVTVTQPSTNLKQVAVMVSWTTQGSGSPTNVALQTYRSGV